MISVGLREDDDEKEMFNLKAIFMYFKDIILSNVTERFNMYFCDTGSTAAVVLLHNSLENVKTSASTCA